MTTRKAKIARVPLEEIKLYIGWQAMFSGTAKTVRVEKDYVKAKANLKTMIESDPSGKTAREMMDFVGGDFEKRATTGVKRLLADTMASETRYDILKLIVEAAPQFKDEIFREQVVNFRKALDSAMQALRKHGVDTLEEHPFGTARYILQYFPDALKESDGARCAALTGMVPDVQGPFRPALARLRAIRTAAQKVWPTRAMANAVDGAGFPAPQA